ncbi:MAG: endonuclease [Gaiellales bacterium]
MVELLILGSSISSHLGRMVAAPPLDVARTDAPTSQPAAGPAAPSVDSYYAVADGKHGVELLGSLHQLASKQTVEHSYVEARQLLFASVEDPADQDVITELYSGREVPNIDGLEAATDAHLNAEHIWPQSQGARDVAKTDLHHLRAADAALNNMRSNLPFGEAKAITWSSPEVKGVDELSVIGTDADGNQVFMPRESVRGDIARDQLYFFTRYHPIAAGGSDARSGKYLLDNFQISLPTLLEWHAKDPVDDAERSRNEAIFHLQGNRNPYVDRPDLVKQVGFDSPALQKAIKGAVASAPR